MSEIKPIAFYLPQFHPVKENSEWWGPGFTEWTNVARAKPNYAGHNQPHIPADLGFYDLRMKETFQAQIELARANSIFGFCFYYYWFSGRRILETPINVFVESGIDFPFCFCWANENWTKKWDGGDNELLLKNEHTIENDNRFIDDILPSLKDSRYITYTGKPLLLIYRPDLLVDSKATFDHWRRRAAEAGLPGLFIASVAFYGIENPSDWGADALVEFPPHKYMGGAFAPPPSAVTNPSFKGGFFDYRLVMAQSVERQHDDFLFFHGAMPSWDNTARRQDTSTIFTHSSPEIFEMWLRNQAVKTLNDSQNIEKFVFINAWNEWAEGCHLEPCQKYGHAHLKAVRRAVRPDRYLSPRIPSDPIMDAMSVSSVKGTDEVKYLTNLEYAYREAVTEIHDLRARERYTDPVNIPYATFLATKLRRNRMVYLISRTLYRTARKLGLPR